tara:strand:- start:804 stop:1817 length:1014 start_codon:yes stop_codon:yes gene_type:complete
MKVLKPEKIIFSLIISFLGLLLSLFVNRGYFIIDSIVGSEYMNIMSSSNFQDFGRLGHRILTPMLSKMFNDIFIFNIVILAFLIFYITYNFYEKYDKATLVLLVFSITTTQVVLFTLNFAYYPDPLTILLAVIAMFNLEKKSIFIFMGFLTLINNEIGIFILFFLVLVSKDVPKRIKTFSLIVLLYLFYRYFINLLIINEDSGIPTYLNELLNFELNFYMIFGIFTGLKFLTIFLLSSKKQLTVLVFLIFYTLIPMNMAVDYTRYGTLLIIIILWVLYNDYFLYKKNIKIIALIVVILNIVTPKYYIWDDQITYLRDSKLHFLDVTGKNFEDRGISD